MPVPAADPRAKDLDAAFASAMTDPAKPRAAAKPPAEIDHEAPLGRGEDGTPLAPYGHNKDGSVRRTNAGRRAKDDPDRPRTGQVVPAGSQGDGKPAAGKDYTEGLLGAADGFWLCLSAAGKLPLGKLRVGKIGLPADADVKVSAQAHLLSQSKGQLVVALNEAAKHSERADRLARKLCEGDATWVMTVASLAGPFVAGTFALWRNDTRIDVTAMAKANEDELDHVMLIMSEAAKAAQEQSLTAQLKGLQAEKEFTAQEFVNGQAPVAAQAG